MTRSRKRHPIEELFHPKNPGFVRLSRISNYVCWKYQEIEGKLKKIPINSTTGGYARVSDPSSWSTLRLALEALSKWSLAGIGIVLQKQLGIVGIDLDKVVDADGTIRQDIRKILDLKETYWEYSPSLTGVRLFADGNIPKALKCDALGIELYDNARYLTLTGKRGKGSRRDIKPAPKTIAALSGLVHAHRDTQLSVVRSACRNVRKEAKEGSDFYRNLNELLLIHLDAWVQELIPEAERSAAGYRVSSIHLHRDLEEDLSITPGGAVDYGTADQGDKQEGKRTPIDLGIEYASNIGLEIYADDETLEPKVRTRNNAFNAAQVANWFCERLNISPWSLGKKPYTDAEWIDYLNQHHAVLREGGRTVVLGYVLDTSYEPPRKKVVLETPASFKDFYSSQYISRSVTKTVRKGGQVADVSFEESEPVGKLWWSSSKRRQFEGLTFQPGKPEIVGKFLNLWSGLAKEPIKGEWSLLRSHIENILACGSAEAAQYIINWCAYAIQYPERPAEVALVLQGKRGTGKGTLGNLMLEIFGQHSLPIRNPYQLVGNFNAHLRNTVFVFADEAYWPGNKGAEGALKGLITEPELFIEPKGRDGASVPNMLKVLMASNEDWVVPAAEFERRFQPFVVSDSKMQDHTYFAELRNQMNNGGIEAFLYDMIHLDLSGWHPRQLVTSKALLDQQNYSMSLEDQWWKSKLEDGYIVGSRSDRADWIYSIALLSDIKRFSQKLQHHNPSSIRPMCEKAGIVPSGKHENKNGKLLPPLAEARRQFEQRFKGTTWDDPDLTEWRYITHLDAGLSEKFEDLWK